MTFSKSWSKAFWKHKANRKRVSLCNEDSFFWEKWKCATQVLLQRRICCPAKGSVISTDSSYLFLQDMLQLHSPLLRTHSLSATNIQWLSKTGTWRPNYRGLMWDNSDRQHSQQSSLTSWPRLMSSHPMLTPPSAQSYFPRFLSQAWISKTTTLSQTSSCICFQGIQLMKAGTRSGPWKQMTSWGFGAWSLTTWQTMTTQWWWIQTAWHEVEGPVVKTLTSGALGLCIGGRECICRLDVWGIWDTERK